MARVTVEDCTKVIHKFELILVAAQRVREIASGAQIMVERDNDKNTVVALREIALDLLNIDALKHSIIKRHQKLVKTDIIDAPDDVDISDIMSQEMISGMKSSISEDSEFDEFLEESMIEISMDDEESMYEEDDM